MRDMSAVTFGWISGIAVALAQAAGAPPERPRPVLPPVVARVTGINRGADDGTGTLERSVEGRSPVRRSLSDTDQFRAGDTVRVSRGAEIRIQFYSGSRRRYRLLSGTAVRILESGSLTLLSGTKPQAFASVPSLLLPQESAGTRRSYGGVAVRGEADEDSFPLELRGLPIIRPLSPVGGVRHPSVDVLTLRWAVVRGNTKGITQTVQIGDPETGRILWQKEGLPGAVQQVTLSPSQLPVLPPGHLVLWSVGVRRGASASGMHRWSPAVLFRPLSQSETAAALRLDRLKLRDGDALRLRAAAYEQLDLWPNALRDYEHALAAAPRDFAAEKGKERIRKRVSVRFSPAPPSAP